MNEELYYTFEEDLHPLEINLTSLICNRINEPDHYEIASEFMSQWKEKFIEVLEKTHLRSETDYLHWQNMLNEQSHVDHILRKARSKIFGYDDGEEFIIDLRQSEAVYLTSNKCIDSENNDYKTINSTEIDKYQLSIAMISKLIEVDVLDIKTFLDFQLSCNFEKYKSSFIYLLNSIVFEYESQKDILGIGKINAIKHYIQMEEKERNNIAIYEIEGLEKEIKTLKEQLKKSQAENDNLKLKISENQNPSLGWLVYKNPARSHFLKFLIRHYLDDEINSSEKISKILMVILQNEIYTPKNQFLPILRGSYFKNRKNSDVENEKFILEILNSIKTTSKSKKILEAKKKEKDELIQAFKEYWNSTKFS